MSVQINHPSHWNPTSLRFFLRFSFALISSHLISHLLPLLLCHSFKALITHYSVTPLSGITLCAAVDHFRCLAALQATVPHSYDLFVAAIAAVTNLAEAVDLNDELTEAVRRGEVGSREAADLAERIAHVQKLYRHGVPTAAWVPDAAADTCMCCTSTRFGTLRRRHHCRNCGNIICSNCCRAGSISEDVQMDKVREWKRGQDGESGSFPFGF